MEKIEIVIQAIDKATKPLRQFEATLSSVGATATKVAKVMAIAGSAIAGAAVAGAAYKGVQAFVEFEDALANVRKTTGMSRKEIEALGKEINRMAQRIPLAQTELAEIAAVAGQLGIQGQENILAFTETVAKAATAFDLQASEAATALAKLANIYNIPIKEIDRLASAINALGNTTAASEAEIIRAMYQIGAAGAQLGATQQQIAAMTTTLISMGMAPERAGTRLQSAFNQMAANLDKIAEDMGLTVDELKEKFSEDFYGTLMEYITALSEKYPNKLDFLTRANEVFGTVGSKAILSLAQANDRLQKNLRTATKAYEENISLQEEFKNKTDTLKASLSLLRNSINSLLIRIGKELAPVVRRIAEVIREHVLPAVDEFLTWLGKLKSAISENRQFQAFVNFINSSIIPAVTTLYGWIKELAGLFVSKDWEGIKEHIKAGIDGAKEAIRNAIDWIIPKLTEMKDKLVEKLSKILPDAFDRFNEWLRQAGEELGKRFEDTWKYVSDTEAIDRMTQEWADAILNGTATMADLFGKGTKKAEESGFFTNLIKLFVNLFKVLGITVYSGILTLGYLIKNLLLRIYPTVRNTLVDIFAKIGKVIGDSLSWIYNNTVVAFINKVIDAINGLWSVLPEPARQAIGLTNLISYRVPTIDLGPAIEARILGLKGTEVNNSVTVNVNVQTDADPDAIADRVGRVVLRRLADMYTVRRGVT
ncbi:phage tail tape measure protein [Geoglobus ahangari]